MPNILFYSANDDFKADLIDQIHLYAKEFEIINDSEACLPDILLIDESLDVLATWQQKYPNTPTFFFSGSAELSENIPAPNHLIIKPFSLSVFLDNLHACLNIFENSEDGYLFFNQYQVRPIKKDILNYRNNEEVKLTEKEVAVIKYLYKAGNRIVTKNELLQEVWGYAPDVTTHTIETHIYRLRQKVEHDNAEAQLIVTSDGGYKLKF